MSSAPKGVITAALHSMARRNGSSREFNKQGFIIKVWMVVQKMQINEWNMIHIGPSRRTPKLR